MKDRKFPKRVKPDVWEMRTKTLEVITDCKPKQLKGKSDLHSLHSSPVLWNYEIKGDEMGGLFRRDYTGCHRRNGPNFGRVFLVLNYTDITQNTYIQS